MKVIVTKNYDEMSAKAAEIMADVIKAKPDCVLGLATGSTPIGMYDCLVEKFNAGEIDFSRFDFVVDAVDTVSAKIEIVMRCQAVNVPVISSMGTGNKLDPTAFEVTDIYKTSVCPLARVMRSELKKRGVKRLKVVYSREEPIKLENCGTEAAIGRRSIPASVSFVPSVAGLIIAGEVIKHLVKEAD